MTDTSKREELIEEASKEAERRWPSPNTSFYEGLVSGFKLGAAWAVFEQAHTPTDKSLDITLNNLLIEDVKPMYTPTDDERIFYCPRHGDLLPRDDDPTDVRSARCQEAHTAAQIHAGFRRTVQGEPTDAPTVQLAARRGGKVQAMIDSMLAQANERGIRVEVVYPQGEPTDAQVEAAGALLYGISWGTDLADPDLVRAALRAAGAIGQKP